MSDPMYVTIAADLAARILSGSLPAGTKLPSARELTAQYGVSVIVIRMAMVDLKARGLIEGRQGKGVYVLPQPPRS